MTAWLAVLLLGALCALTVWLNLLKENDRG